MLHGFYRSPVRLPRYATPPRGYRFSANFLRSGQLTAAHLLITGTFALPIPSPFKYYADLGPPLVGLYRSAKEERRNLERKDRNIFFSLHFLYILYNIFFKKSKNVRIFPIAVVHFRGRTNITNYTNDNVI